MLITDEMVDYVAVLSRLKLSPEERTKVREALGSIIEYMDVLNNLDTEGVEPMSHVFAVKKRVPSGRSGTLLRPRGAAVRRAETGRGCFCRSKDSRIGGRVWK